MTISWNTGAARARYNLGLKKNKKIKKKSKCASAQASKLDRAQAIGYCRIMKKKYWLLDYFIRPNHELAPSYIKKVEKFLKCLKKKQFKLPGA